MIKIVIIGSGSVAQHLLSAFANGKVGTVVQLFSRKPKFSSPYLDTIQITSNYNEIQEADLYIIAVSDNAIEEVSNNLPFTNKFVVHTSGTAPLTIINAKNRRGVFYPLQTFSKQYKIDFKNIPLCLETEVDADYTTLESIAKSISNEIYTINSTQRKALHVAAVFVNNFVNHMYKIGNDICIENGISFHILKPLILETANKIIAISPSEAQTGPAQRNDTNTINKQLQFLSNPNQKKIYQILTKSIVDNEQEL
jgi:predicted short-subunit dehydrogenase-like oxidoreductase (DUF2520 family)